MLIRAATPRDLPLLPDIETDAGQLFAAVGLDEVARHSPHDLDDLRHYLDTGLLLVAEDDANAVLAALEATEVDGCGYVAEVSVRRSAARQGIGAALIEGAAEWARAHGLPALTLTTFTEVPWNGPYYERLGFRPVAVEEESPGLRRIRAFQATIGLDQWPRQCMRRDL